MNGCAPPTICGPRTFWSFQKMACADTVAFCTTTTSCAPQDMMVDPDGGLMKRNWLKSVIYTLLASDRQTTCYDATRRRRGDPADAFRPRRQAHGNSFWQGYKGTTQEQLSAMAADMQAQIKGFFKQNGIAAMVTVQSSFAGAGIAKLDFTIGQDAISVTGRRNGSNYNFIWDNI